MLDDYWLFNSAVRADRIVFAELSTLSQFGSNMVFPYSRFLNHEHLTWLRKLIFLNLFLIHSVAIPCFERINNYWQIALNCCTIYKLVPRSYKCAATLQTDVTWELHDKRFVVFKLEHLRSQKVLISRCQTREMKQKILLWKPFLD